MCVALKIVAKGRCCEARRTAGKEAVEGDVDDYAEGDYDLFGSKFLYNKFGM